MNTSNAFGEIAIPKEYVKDCEDILNEYIEDFEPNFYGVQHWNIEEDDDELVLSFWGWGIGSFDVCAYDKFDFFGLSNNPKAKKVLDYFDSIEDLELPMWFVDEEIGGRMLYRFVGYWTNDGAEGNIENFAYTSANLVALECYPIAVDGNNEKDIEQLAEDVADNLGCRVTEQIREAVRNTIAREEYGGVLTEGDLMYFDEAVEEELDRLE